MSNELEPTKSKSMTLAEQTGLKIDAQLDTQILTARAFPRDLKACMQNILTMATIDQEVAQACYYTLPRAGKSLTGPSIRFAELCAYNWGNIQVGSEIVSNDGKNVVVRGYCIDLQNNFKATAEVIKSIRMKDGKPYSPDMQAVACAAASAVARRNAIFAVIPQAFVDKAYKKAMEFAINGVVPDNKGKSNEEIIQKHIDRVIQLGVTIETILHYYNKESVNEITPEELKEIIGIGTSIKDGFIRVEEAFVNIS